MLGKPCMHREIVAVLSFRGMRVSKIELKLYAESPSRACRVLMKVGGGKMKNIISMYTKGFSSSCEYEINCKWKKKLIYVKIDNGKSVMGKQRPQVRIMI